MELLLFLRSFHKGQQSLLFHFFLCWAPFGTQKVLGGREKNEKENDFPMFGSIVENIKIPQIFAYFKIS